MKRLAGLGVLRRGAVPQAAVGRLALTDAPHSRDPGTPGDVEGAVIMLGRFGFALLRRGAKRSP
ncbi:hypothetical protein ACFW9M_04500 [Streptomyces lydicus]|uniref:hypothetical protein n=1 Tax=Streptomyces lydicus TaxID=47763 RepID=UPI003694A3ED